VCLGRVVLYCSNTRRAAEGDCPRKNAVVVVRGVGRVPVWVLCLGFVRVPLLFWLHNDLKNLNIIKYLITMK